LSGRRHEHGAGGRTGTAQRLVEPAHRRRAARFLVAKEWIGVELVVGRRVLELDLVQPHLELFRDQHRHRGVGALSHFDLIHDERDPSIGADANERVGREGGGGAAAAAVAVPDRSPTRQPSSSPPPRR